MTAPTVSSAFIPRPPVRVSAARRLSLGPSIQCSGKGGAASLEGMKEDGGADGAQGTAAPSLGRVWGSSMGRLPRVRLPCLQKTTFQKTAAAHGDLCNGACFCPEVTAAVPLQLAEGVRVGVRNNEESL